MKLQRRLVSAVLMLSMLLSLLGGGFSTAAASAVTTDSELACVPLSETRSIAYEQHEAGYSVSLDREEDCMTMHITAVPQAGRSREKARLYVRTGVTLKPGVVYRVGFSLKAEEAVEEYAVFFDGASGAGAYGSLTGRGIQAGGTDRVSYDLTPKAAAGELVLRLHLGKAGVNALRFSDLSVDQVSPEEVGENTLLADRLNLSAPGFIRLWTNTDAGAQLACEEDSATMTVTKGVPEKDAKAWKIKLFVATGIQPKAGNAYRFRAEVEATAWGEYEVCFNEGETEKGYGVEYSQYLLRGSREVEYLIHVPKEDKDPGELILQFSLGMLKTGDKVTLRNIRVEEATLKYTSALDKDFSYKEATQVWAVEPEKKELSAIDSTPEISWDGKGSIAKDGNKAGALTITGGKAKLKINGGQEVWDAKLKVDTGETLKAGTTCRVSFKIKATRAYSDYEVLYGNPSEDTAYEGLYGRSLAADAEDTVTVFLTPSAETAGRLLIVLQLGNTGGKSNTVTVSDFKIEEMTYGDNVANMKYPVSAVSPAISPEVSLFVTEIMRTDDGGSNSADRSIDAGRCKLEVKEGGCGNRFDSRLVINTNVTLEANKNYQVSFDIRGRNEEGNWQVEYCRDDPWRNLYVRMEPPVLPSITETAQTITSEISSGDTPGTLFLNLSLGASLNTYWVSNIKVMPIETAPEPCAILIPMGDDAGNSAVRSIEGDSFKLNVTNSDAKGDYKSRLVINTGVYLDAKKKYQVSFDIQGKNEEPAGNWHVEYHRDETYGPDYAKLDKWENNLPAIPQNKSLTVVRDISVGDDAGTLFLNICLGMTVNEYLVRNIKVTEVGSGAESPWYTHARDIAQLNHGYVEGDGTSYVTMTCTGQYTEAYQRGLVVEFLKWLDAGKCYQLSYDITATRDTTYHVHYNREDCYNGEDKVNYFGEKQNLTAGTENNTVKQFIAPEKAGNLHLLYDFGLAAEDTRITVGNVQLVELTSASSKTIGSFGAVSEEHNAAYTAALTKTSNSATLAVTSAPAVSTAEDSPWQGYNAKLFIRTGLVPSDNTYYRVSFDIQATQAQKAFHALYNGAKDKDYGDQYNLALEAGTKKTVTHTIPAGSSKGELVIQLELGLIDQTEGNTFTVDNLKVEEVSYNMIYSYRNWLAWYDGAPYLYITKSPFYSEENQVFSGDEWRVKMFIDTGLTILKDESCRVSFDVRAEEDMNFGVCYNKGGEEKEYGSIYDIIAEKGKTKTVEYYFTASDYSKDDHLILQIMFGNVMAPNEILVDNLKVEYVTYTYAQESALPDTAKFEAPSAVSYWAHEDYATSLTGTGSAVTMHITQPPEKSPEAWKVKLFLDTGVTLQPGKNYKVASQVRAEAAQDFEVCYNNGGVENGYESQGGLRLAAGTPLAVEKIISVPKDKADPGVLMLQYNLGKTSAANAITISDVRVEEVALSYDNRMPQGFQYTAGGTVASWTNTDYTASLEGLGDRATLHITGVPSTGAEVWKAKLLVNTGATLCAGKTYLVRARLLSEKAQGYEVCFNNEETEKGFDALYNQSIAAKTETVLEKNIIVPASMTDAGELVLQFSVGGPEANDFTVSGVTVQELNFGGSSGKAAPDTVLDLKDPAGTLEVTGQKLTYRTQKLAARAEGSAITAAGASLRANDSYTVTFTAKADKNITGGFLLRQGDAAAISRRFSLTTAERTYSFTTDAPLPAGGAWDLLWQFGGEENQKLGGANVELSGITVYSPAELLEVAHSRQNLTVNGEAVRADAYNINGSNYVKLRDLAMLLNDTDAQFVVRYNSQSKTISLTTGKPYSPVGGELTVGEDRSASCVRTPATILVNGREVMLKAYSLKGNNFFRLRDLGELLGFQVDYIAESKTVALASPLTPEAQEKGHAYDLFFLPEIDGETQPYVGDTMPYYEDGTYYIYYLKDGGDSYNHSIYLTTTTDFVTYRELDEPVLSASREDVQDNWIGTGSVVKAEDAYYLFYTGFAPSHEYREKIMVAKGSSPTFFEKVSGWEITPPAELGQKTDFRDPQAYYDPASKTFSLTVTAAQDGKARILKYTLDKALRSPKYDGIIFTDPTGEFWNLECSDTFRLGDKWYLTYSGQEDTLWYATASARFGPYSNAKRLDGKLFYAAKHVEDGENSYMVGWARRGNSASSTEEVAGWAGNVAVQKLEQKADGSLALVPVDSILSSFATPVALDTTEASFAAAEGCGYREAFTTGERFLLQGAFTCTGTGSFGLAFDFNGNAEQYKRISIDPAAGKLSLAFNEGATPITETEAALQAGKDYSFTYIQDGSVGIFYIDGVASLLVRLYGVTDKPVYLFAENAGVTFTQLRQYTP